MVPDVVTLPLAGAASGLQSNTKKVYGDNNLKIELKIFER